MPVVTGFVRRMRLALALGSLAGCISGCVWVDEEIPADSMRLALDYSPALVEPVRVSAIAGWRFATTGEIAGFLGTRNFRMAFAYRNDRQPSPGAGVYVVTPGADDQPPLIHLYSRGRETFLGEGQADMIRSCLLSPDGKFLAYSLSQAYSRPSAPPTVWMQGLAAGATWRVPLASSANQSLGIPGDAPFWLHSQGKTYILFSGRERGITPADSTGQAMLRQVEILAPTRFSPIVPFRLGNRTVQDTVSGISRDGKWFVSEEPGLTYLLDSAQVSDRTQPRGGAVRIRAIWGASAISLNPFDPGRTANTDFYAMVYTPSLIYEPWRTLDGSPVTGEEFGRSVLVANSRKEIIYWKSILSDPMGSLWWARWSTHPNFIVAAAGDSVTAVKLETSVDAIHANPGDRTREGAAAFVILRAEDLEFSLRQGDFSLWVEE